MRSRTRTVTSLKIDIDSETVCVTVGNRGREQGSTRDVGIACGCANRKRVMNSRKDLVVDIGAILVVLCRRRHVVAIGLFIEHTGQRTKLGASVLIRVSGRHTNMSCTIVIGDVALLRRRNSRYL